MNKSRFFSRSFFVAFFFMPHFLQAQEVKVLSLKEAIELGLENSKFLKVSDAAIKEAEAKVTESRMHQLPDFKVSAAYMRMNTPSVDLKIPLGGQGGSDSIAKGGSSFEVNQMMYAMANASLPLFSGFKIHNGIQSAKYLKTATELDAQKDRLELVQNTIAAYYNLYKANKAVDLIEENLKHSESRVHDFENLEKNGLLARNDLLKAQLQKSNVELTLSDAKSKRDIAQFNLNLQLSIKSGTILQLDGLVNHSILPKITSLEEWQKLAHKHRADFLSLQQKQLAAKEGIQIAKGDYFPSLALTGGYVAGNIPNVVTISNALNIGVGLSYNLAALYKTGSKVKAAKARSEQIRWTLANAGDRLKVEVFKAFEEYQESLRKVSMYKIAVEQSDENYRITKNKYDNALETTTNLLEADVAQLQAHLNFEFAKVDALVAYNKLYETAGLVNPDFEK